MFGSTPASRNEFELCKFFCARASNSLPIGLKEINYCQNSHMHSIVTYNTGPLTIILPRAGTPI